MVGVAQLVRASGCGPEGRGFESLHSPQKYIDTLLGMRSLCRESALGARCGESLHSPQKYRNTINMNAFNTGNLPDVGIDFQGAPELDEAVGDAQSLANGPHSTLTPEEQAEWVSLYLANDHSARYYELNCKRCGGSEKIGIDAKAFGKAAADARQGKSSEINRALISDIRKRLTKVASSL